MAVTPKPIPSFVSLQQSPAANPAQLLLAGGDMVEDPEAELPPLFNQLLNFGEKHGEDEEKDVNMDILVDENEEDAIPPSCPDVVAWQLHWQGNSPLPMSAVLACMKELRGYWDKPFHHQGSLWPGDC